MGLRHRIYISLDSRQDLHYRHEGAYAVESIHVSRKAQANGASPILKASPRTKLTSIASLRDNIIAVCSTSRLTWLDVRHTRTPLFAWAHCRAASRSLSLHATPLSRSAHFHPQPPTSHLFAAPLVFLSDPANAIVSIYDVDRSEGLLHAFGQPAAMISALPAASGALPRGGFCFGAGRVDGDGFVMYELGARGGVFCTPLACDAADVRWDGDVCGLEHAADLMREDGGACGEREFRTYDVRNMYCRKSPASYIHCPALTVGRHFCGTS